MSFELIITLLIAFVLSAVVLFVRTAFRRPVLAMGSSFAGSVLFLISVILCLVQMRVDITSAGDENAV